MKKPFVEPEVLELDVMDVITASFGDLLEEDETPRIPMP